VRQAAQADETVRQAAQADETVRKAAGEVQTQVEDENLSAADGTKNVEAEQVSYTGTLRLHTLVA
jgi:hypothetical protein